MNTKVKIIPCYGLCTYEDWEREINEFLLSAGGLAAKVDFVSATSAVVYAIITYQDV